MDKDYKKLYEEALERARDLHDNHALGMPFIYQTCEDIFPELCESEDDKIRKEIIQSIQDNMCVIHKDKCLAWLEKQVNIPHFTFDDILALQCAMKTAEKADNELYEQLKSLHDRLHDAYWLEKQGEQKPVPDWMPKFLDELRSRICFGWDEDKEIVGRILAIIEWMSPNYFNGKDGEQKPTDKVEPKFHEGEWVTIKE